MATQAKPAPVKGMAVTWIDPSEDPRNARFIEETLHRGYGRDGLRVHEVRQNGVIVVLERGGKPLTNCWSPAWGPAPADFTGTVTAFDWGYLKPI